MMSIIVYATLKHVFSINLIASTVKSFIFSLHEEVPPSLFQTRLCLM